MKIYIVVTDVVNDVTYSRKSVITRVWSYDFYDMTLSTGKQRRHMINTSNNQKVSKTSRYPGWVLIARGLERSFRVGLGFASQLRNSINVKMIPVATLLCAKTCGILRQNLITTWLHLWN